MNGNTGLQVIFSIFLGLMLAVFLGVGVYTFYPPPDTDAAYAPDEYPVMESPSRDTTASPDMPVAKGSEEVDANAALREGEERARVRDTWRQRTSIILIILATLSMVVSLIRSHKLPVISSGLLLGGVFTMVYGVGWTVSTGLSTGRFVVVTAAFVVTLVLGWLRFARAAGPGLPDPVGRDDHLAERIRQLEERLDKTAQALGGGSGAER
ncbi:MAG: hypothetical protein COV99_09965 [Bacteroidetes bacterium CG12_big_fil_rev_8_21_14_0_65_60_17]|nr:MAG: hypothetical protein COV99_09965 [Bacteroidetes bacterium CG12_big_fil_rev_8_21_14_0_65_60_17]